MGVCCVYASYMQSKSRLKGRRSQPLTRGVRGHHGYSRARCSYRRAVDANFSFSTPPDKSLFASSHTDSLSESELINNDLCRISSAGLQCVSADYVKRISTYPLITALFHNHLGEPVQKLPVLYDENYNKTNMTKFFEVY